MGILYGLFDLRFSRPKADTLPRVLMTSWQFRKRIWLEKVWTHTRFVLHVRLKASMFSVCKL
jgi:hypothetical protein